MQNVNGQGFLPNKVHSKLLDILFLFDFRDVYSVHVACLKNDNHSSQPICRTAACDGQVEGKVSTKIHVLPYPATPVA